MNERGERWRQLCAQAAEEQDPDRLMELIREIKHNHPTHFKDHGKAELHVGIAAFCRRGSPSDPLRTFLERLSDAIWGFR